MSGLFIILCVVVDICFSCYRLIFVMMVENVRIMVKFKVRCLLIFMLLRIFMFFLFLVKFLGEDFVMLF